MAQKISEGGGVSRSSKVTKCNFSKSILLRSYAQKEKTFWTPSEVKIRSRSPKVIQCKFLKSQFLSSYAQKMHFKHHVRSKSGQGHQRSSSANFPKSVFLSSYVEKKYFRHRGRSKSSQGHQRSSSANFQNVYFSASMHRKAFWTSWEVKIRLGSLLVTKCKFSMNV